MLALFLPQQITITLGRKDMTNYVVSLTVQHSNPALEVEDQEYLVSSALSEEGLAAAIFGLAVEELGIKLSLSQNFPIYSHCSVHWEEGPISIFVYVKKWEAPTFFDFRGEMNLGIALEEEEEEPNAALMDLMSSNAPWEQ